MRTFMWVVGTAVALVVGWYADSLWKWWHQPSPVPAAPITLKLARPAKLGRLVEIDAAAVKGVTSLTWTVLSAPTTADGYDFSAEGIEADLVSPVGGDFHVEVLGVYQKAPVRADLTVTIPGPGPGPGPTPDAFQQALQAAYTADTDTGKATLKTALAGVYTQAATDITSSALATWRALFTKMQAAAQAAGVAKHLLATDKVIQAELTRALPFGLDQALTDATRQQGAAEFTKVSTALGKVQ